MSDEKPVSPQPEEEKGGSRHIEVKVISADGSEVFFKVKPTTPLSKLMRAYCQRQGIDIKLVRFLYDGERIREDQTPSQLEMEHGDIIDAMVEQIGGF